MPLEAPHWLFIGLAYAAGAATLATAAFALGEYAFPVQPGERGGRDRSADGGRRVSGAARRRAEIGAYLASIDECVVEEATVRGVDCEFYLPDRDVAVTLDADTYHRLRTTDTYVVFCEHELRGRDLGARLPFDTPDQRARERTRPGAGSGHRSASRGAGGWRRTTRGATARASGSHQQREEAVAAAYRTLGLSRNASASEVKAAYREKVKDVHPDHGGSEAAFTHVQEAYATAKADAS